MALAVASTSTVTGSSADTLVITKPSGVTVGDLLVIVASGEHDGNNGLGNSQIACSGFTKQLSPSREANNSNTDLNLGSVLLWKIADSGDVSASNYTITLAGSESLGLACMFRITGWTSGNPVYSSHTSNSSISPSSLSLGRPSSQLLIMCVARKDDDEGWSFGSYSVTSGDSNPTWTEVQDTYTTVNNTTDARRVSHGVAYAITSSTSAITAYSATATDLNVGTNGTASDISFLAVICEPADATGTNNLHSVEPVIFGNTSAVVGTAGTNALHEPSPEFFDQSGSGTAPTQWTNEAKPTDTSWTNESK